MLSVLNRRRALTDSIDNSFSSELPLIMELLDHFEELALLETQCRVLHDACKDALADNGHPDGKLLCELKLLAHELKYQIAELRGKIAALEDEME